MKKEEYKKIIEKMYIYDVITFTNNSNGDFFSNVFFSKKSINEIINICFTKKYNLTNITSLYNNILNQISGIISEHISIDYFNKIIIDDIKFENNILLICSIEKEMIKNDNSKGLGRI